MGVCNIAYRFHDRLLCRSEIRKRLSNTLGSPRLRRLQQKDASGKPGNGCQLRRVSDRKAHQERISIKP